MISHLLWGGGENSKPTSFKDIYFCIFHFKGAVFPFKLNVNFTMFQNSVIFEIGV